MNILPIQGNLKPIKDHVLVHNMYFGERQTSGGIILRDDDGKEHGIRPRWAQVYAKGPENEEPYNVSDWVLIEHGRWTRAIKLDINGQEETVHRVDVDSILLYSNEAPSTDEDIGKEYGPNKTESHKPEDFGAN